MQFANSQISDIIATTIQNRSGDLADNVTNNNAALYQMNKKGNVKPFSGGNVIMQELMYNDPNYNNTNSYSGYELINISPNSPISAAQFDIKQYASAITINGLEMLQNSGKEAIIDLLDSRMQVAESQLMNRIDLDLFADGTGNGGKNLTGFAAAISTTPTTGTYGGINRANYTFWNNVAFSGVTNGGAAVSASNILQYMNAVSLQLVRGTDRPDLIIADTNYYNYFLQAMQAIQRVTDGNLASAGFTALKYLGTGASADVVLGSGIGGSSPANQMLFINTNYLLLRPHKDRNFVPIGGDRQAVNQDAIVKLIGWAGNMTSRGVQFQGILSA